MLHWHDCCPKCRVPPHVESRSEACLFYGERRSSFEVESSKRHPLDRRRTKVNESSWGQLTTLMISVCWSILTIRIVIVSSGRQRINCPSRRSDDARSYCQSHVVIGSGLVRIKSWPVKLLIWQNLSQVAPVLHFYTWRLFLSFVSLGTYSWYFLPFGAHRRRRGQRRNVG